MKKSEIKNIHICEIFPNDTSWPKAVNALNKVPTRLRFSGELPTIEKSLAIVGTRKADRDALDFTYETAFQLAKEDITIVSGGARGIDAAAHQGALDAGGKTVAVLASGLRFAYPAEHAPLFTTIAQNGALITEVEDQVAPMAGRFIQRNRLIAAFSKAVWVVQAPAKSGALHTAKFAKQLSKKVFSTTFAPWDIRGQGCLELIKKGADVCLSSSDLLQCFNDEKQQTLKWHLESSENTSPKTLQASSAEKEVLPNDPVQRHILENMGSQKLHVDEIANYGSFSISEIQSALLSLIIHGWVREDSPGWYCRIKK